MTVPILKDRIWLSSPEESRSPSGAVKKGWTDLRKVYAAVEYLASRVYTAALAEQTGCTVRVVIRRRPVASGRRALVDRVTYAVKTVEPHRERGFLVLMLEKDDGNG
jgi:SPP1 family predicted phage head-tail adaptor